jgi:hypothetical protein
MIGRRGIHGGKTPQITGRADKTCNMMYAVIVYNYEASLTDESGCWWGIYPA